MPNALLFARIDDQITAHPEDHNQAAWTCGTARCVFGWAVQFSKPDPTEDDLAFKVRYAQEHGLRHRAGDLDTSWLTVGGHLLGLDGNAAWELAMDTDEDEAVVLVREYAGRTPEGK